MRFNNFSIKLRFFSVLMLLFLGMRQSLQAQTYLTGKTTVIFNDPTRTGGFPSGGPGRQIQSELYYPAVSAGTNTALATGRFPIIVFAHGFAMTWDSYEILYDSLVRNGYIVVAPRTEGSLTPAPVHTEFGKDLAFVLDKSLQFDTIASSSFFGKVLQKGAIMGHSMGGGSTFLADQYNSRATCYFTMAPANTNPRSSLAAKTISKPFCILGGTKDCIAPIADNQQLMYDSLLVSACKQLIKITDARHCSFSDGGSFQCNTGEGLSGCASVSNGYSTAMQNVTVRNISVPYFNYFLKGICSEWAVYQNYITTTSRLVTSQSCTMNVPSNAMVSGISSFCVGDSTTLTASPSGFSYGWSNGSNTITNNVTTAGSYTVSVSNPYCSITSSPFNVVASSSTTTNQTKAACVSYVFNGQTKTQSGVYRDTLLGRLGCDSFVVLNLTINQPSLSAFFDSICTGSSYQFGTQILSQAGQYTRTILNSTNCDSVITLNLFVKPTPSVIITQSGANLTATAGFASYEWKLNGNTIATTSAPSYFATSNGSYTVKAIDGNGCESSVSSTVQVIGMSLASLDGSNIDLSVAPNPVSEILTISATGKVIEVNLYDIQGKKIKTTQATSKIDMQSINAGVYFIEVKTTAGTGKAVLVKE